MRLAASLALLPAIAAAHEGYQGPRLFGAPGLKMPRGLAKAAHASHSETRSVKEARQEPIGGTDGRCGPQFGGASCAEGYCCSESSWCGKNKDYCAAPNCQFAYGSGCATNLKPSGPDTSNDARPHVGKVAYGGAGLYHCTVPGTVALTYDDGPYIYTDGLLDLLKQYGAKATFFITGNNIGKGAIDTTPAWSSVIKRMADEGHHIASHTWTHQNLDSVSDEVRRNEMVYNEIALQNILGYFPTYMRPPYSACIKKECTDTMSDLGYHITFFDVDSDDYNNLSPEKIQTAKDNFGDLVKPPTSNKYLAIAHDIHELSAVDLSRFMLDHIKENGFRAVTLGECLGDPIENWYRNGGPSGGGSSSSAGPTGGSSSSASPSESSGGDGSSDGPAPTGGCNPSCGGGDNGGDDDSDGPGGSNGSSSVVPSGSGTPNPPTHPSATPPKPTDGSLPEFTGAASLNGVGGLVAAMAIAVAAL